MSNSKSKLFKLGIPAALLAGGATAGMLLGPISLASAAESTDTDTDNGETSGSVSGKTDRGAHRGARGNKLEPVAEALGTTAEELKTQLKDGQTLAEIAGDDVQAVKDVLRTAAEERIAEAVADEKISQEEADEKLASLDEHIDSILNGEHVAHEGKDGHGKGNKKGHGPKGNLAEVLGLTQDELKAEIESGKTVAEVAEAQGVSVADLVDELMADFDERVAEKDLDADEVEAKRAEVEEKISDRLNGETPERDGEQRSDRRGQRGQRGQRGERPTEESSDSADAGQVVDSSI